MRIPRIYHAGPLSVGHTVTLSQSASQHVLRVLRTKISSQLILFNGDGDEFIATLMAIEKNLGVVMIESKVTRHVESPLHIHLGQGISRGERMDFTIQKAVEIGVGSITPLFTERCEVKLRGDRLTKKTQHWQNIVIHACEQSGRNIIPTIHTPQPLSDWLAQCSGLSLVGDPEASTTLCKNTDTIEHVNLLIGPEGGLSPDEIHLAKQCHFQGLSLGPRVLRTETAALVAMTLLQREWGDY